MNVKLLRVALIFVGIIGVWIYIKHVWCYPRMRQAERISNLEDIQRVSPNEFMYTRLHQFAESNLLQRIVAGERLQNDNEELIALIR